MNPDVRERLYRVVADTLSVPFDELGPECSPDTIETWDSLKHLNLVLALEQEFGIRFTQEEIERLTSIDQMARLLDQKLTSAEIGHDG